jgi:predicted DNA binding CopG/RHH family protein
LSSDYFKLNNLQSSSESSMKVETLQRRLNPNRPMTSVTIRMPEEVVEDLKRIAPLLGFSGYQPLIRAYVGQGLRVDLERWGGSDEAREVDEGRSEVENKAL